MGNCVGGANVEENIFKVTNINDDKDLVQKGLMEVSPTELVYTDNKSKEDWHWPLKYLRKYGCDGDVFTFEAGRKCPGGEGLYAFSTRKANVLFDIVARNINQGNLQPSGDLSPFSEPTEDSNVLSFPQRHSTTSPVQEQPSYTNLDLSGKPLENGSHMAHPESAGPITSPDPKKFLYREVIFDKPPDEHPKPAPSTVPQNSSYTRIDFDETNRYNEKRKRGDIHSQSSVMTPHGRTCSTSTTMGGGSTSPTKRTSASRSRVHTYTSGTRDRHVSRSESSFSSQSSLTESSRDVRAARANLTVPHPSLSDPNHPQSTTYQNVNMALDQQQYQNVNIGAGNLNQVFDTQQPNYCNVSLSPGAEPHTVLLTTGNGVHTGKLRTSSLKINGGDSMTTYAQLELSSDKHSSSSHISYMPLDFPKGEGSRSSPSHTSEENETRRKVSTSVLTSSSSSSSSSAIENNHQKKTVFHHHHHGDIPEEDSTHISKAQVMDDTKVTYGVLDFSSMQAVAELSTQRELEIEQEKERRERASTQSSKKKK